MRVAIDYKEEISYIDQMLKDLPKEMQAEERKVLSKAGAAIKKNVVRYLHSSDIESLLDIEPKNYDGTRPYVHMKDDVRFTVKKNKQGALYVSVKGGKYTGYKWHLANDGHIARDGKTFVPGLKFMERALQASEGDIEAAINDMMKKVMQ
ncbi:MAG: hypothetical protein LBN31_15470 [Hungatella sp.]|jgi:hypothetical protein|nr:hypothetical protein [Hungatella sp.]